MTVQELIKRLHELPPDAIALVRDQNGELVRVDDVDIMPMQGVAERVYISGTI